MGLKELILRLVPCIRFLDHEAHRQICIVLEAVGNSLIVYANIKGNVQMNQSHVLLFSHQNKCKYSNKGIAKPRRAYF